MTRAGCKLLAKAREGAAAVEFALIAPIMLVGMFGVFDLGYNMYTAAVLEGAIQEAARNATIEGAATGDLDNRLADVVHNIAPKADLTFERTAYANFSDVRQPEDFTDVNDNGVCDNGEPFEDANGNGTWDMDRGSAGQGGARDAVLYEVSVTYPRPFPIGKLIGQSGDFTMSTRTVLRNQPFSIQADRAGTGNCS
ncbi:MAG: pilus assembly protein [Novosphingobium sp.]|nr:pilus assembly protein [Novosphingobium sp.]MCP5402641.1 pilus assembly protein [Novosphingobium sp.]